MKNHGKAIIAQHRARKEAHYRAHAVIYRLISIYAIYIGAWVTLSGLDM